MRKNNKLTRRVESLVLFILLLFFSQNGNAQSFQLVKDIRSGNGNGYSAIFEILTSQTTLNKQLYFQGNDGLDGTLWVTDGTEAGTKQVSNTPGSIPSYPRYFANMNDKVYCIGNGTSILWESDGTEAGTKTIAQISTSTLNSIVANNYLTALNGKLYFFGYETTHGKELWISDGTPTGTKLLKDINPNTGDSNPANMTIFKDKIYFTADDGTNGTQLWVTDGTEAGTERITNLSSLGTTFIPFKDRLYFSGSDGSSGSGNGTELWATDGTEAGTALVKDINPSTASGYPSSLTATNDYLYFTAFTNATGYELWKSDGTEAGTALVKDINPGSGHASITDLATLNDKVFFRADNGSTNTALWISDGTENGTKILKDVANQQGIGGPSSFTVFNNKLYYIATEFLGSNAVWVTDGTEAGTTKFTSSPNNNNFGADQMFVSGNKLYYTPNTSAQGVELWVYEVPVQDQSITFDLGADATKTMGDATFELTATASSGLDITYTSSDETIATITGSTVTILGVGTTTITASQVGNDFYNAAADITQTLTVNDVNSGGVVTSLERLENNTISLYPNPTSDIIQIEGLTGIVSFTLVDVQGQEVLSGQAEDNFELDLSDLASGIYTLTFGNNNQIISKKIVKK